MERPVPGENNKQDERFYSGNVHFEYSTCLLIANAETSPKRSHELGQRFDKTLVYGGQDGNSTSIKTHNPHIVRRKTHCAPSKAYHEYGIFYGIDAIKKILGQAHFIRLSHGVTVLFPGILQNIQPAETWQWNHQAGFEELCLLIQ